MMKGAEKLRQKILLASAACLVTVRRDSTETVRKNPAE
jgi:hypothetical protein